MPEIATSEWEIVLFYNPNHPGSQKTLAYAMGEGLPLRDVDIIKNQFTGTQLEELAGRLGLPIDGLVNKEHPHYDKHYANADFDDEGWIKIMRKNPVLIKEPIAIRGHKAIIVNTPSDLSRL
ncbi:arsenate reductase family protein [Pareuzebyella sediminis]|uniref:arsenate reductase family protein n=1 Tax=Pareuzebyella sediminis TaxID=2607998 RepID=UPI0018E19423|nr:ArsC/Spx/MgsR family protein [Pareuzebyella sediminis]